MNTDQPHDAAHWRSQLMQLLAAPQTPPDPDAPPLGQVFAAQGRLPAETLAVDIEGLGPLLSPLPAAQGAALHGLSEPSPFGWREQTLFDTDIRNSGEVEADFVGLEWAPGAFAALQQAVAHNLGLEAVEAHLSNLLVYGPGQFFKPHQDTEKHPRMVATLVLIWPSAHQGGTLRVAHGRREALFASQQEHEAHLRWFAFYADCRHEVLPVQEGWRVALTFDLLLPARPALPAVDTPAAQAWQAQVNQALAQVVVPGPPERLTPWLLLLDHEYTEHGLRWGLLKGDDRWRVAALRRAAEALGLTVHLALAELQETWSAEEPPRRPGYLPKPQPTDLIEESLTLDFWVDADNRVGPRHPISVSRDDADCFAPTDASHLVSEEYEGYMGNHGETLDYWYRRAAVVVQSPLGAEQQRFSADFDAALADACALARQGGSADTLAQRLAAVATTLRWQLDAKGRALLAPYAELASALPDDEAALALLEPLKCAGLLPQDAATLRLLELRRGTPWLGALLRTWSAPHPQRSLWQTNWVLNQPATAHSPQLWPVDLPAFTRACQAAGLSHDALQHAFQAWLAALHSFDQARASNSPSARQAHAAEGPALLAELSQSLLLHRGQALLAQLLDHVRGQPKLYPLPTLADWALSLHRASPGWAPAQPPRAPADFGLRALEWSCRCKDCAPAIAWAESPSAEPLVLAMAEFRRQHVQSQLSTAGAPLRMDTVKLSSPHKLVLHKPSGLHAAEEAQRQRWALALAALQD